MRRRYGNGSTRDRYLAELRYLDNLYGAGFGHPWARQIADLEAGKPVVVQHAYEIDLHPSTPGPFRLEADGSVTHFPATLAAAAAGQAGTQASATPETPR